MTMTKVSHLTSQLNSEHPFCLQNWVCWPMREAWTHPFAICSVLWWACLKVLICFMYFGVICLIFAWQLRGIFVIIHCKYAHIICNWHMWNRCRAAESNRNVNSNCVKRQLLLIYTFTEQLLFLNSHPNKIVVGLRNIFKYKFLF